MNQELIELIKAHRREIYKAIDAEREYQDEKWGDVSENPHTIGEWLRIMEKKITDARMAQTEGDGSFAPVAHYAAALQEILQVAAVAVACMDQHGLVLPDR